ncbi:MAG: hypothetical protein ACPG8W_03410 [Candidatus Promineifilaceae bacterium]
MSQKNSSEQTVALANMIASIGCTTTLASMAIVGAAFGLGIWLDGLLGTRPIMTFVALAGSFPVTLYVIVRLSLNAVARANRIREELEKENSKQNEDSS